MQHNIDIRYIHSYKAAQRPNFCEKVIFHQKEICVLVITYSIFWTCMVRHIDIQADYNIVLCLERL